MKANLYWACFIALAFLTNCGGGKDTQATEQKTEEKTEEKTTDTPEKKPEAKSNKANDSDLTAMLEGTWELVEAFDPGGEKMKVVKGSISFTKTDYTEVMEYVGSPAQTSKGTWSFNPEIKNEDNALNCIMFKNSELGEYGWNLMAVSEDELVLVFTTMPEKRIYKRK